MDLCVVRVWEKLYAQIPVLLALGDLMLNAGDDSLLELFGMPLGLQMVFCRPQKFYAQVSAYERKELV